MAFFLVEERRFYIKLIKNNKKNPKIWEFRQNAQKVFSQKH